MTTPAAPAVAFFQRGFEIDLEVVRYRDDPGQNISCFQSEFATSGTQVHLATVDLLFQFPQFVDLFDQLLQDPEETALVVGFAVGSVEQLAKLFDREFVRLDHSSAEFDLVPPDLGAATGRFPAVGAFALTELPHQGLGEREVRVMLDNRDQVANDTGQGSGEELSLLRLFALSDHLAELPKAAV